MPETTNGPVYTMNPEQMDMVCFAMRQLAGLPIPKLRVRVAEIVHRDNPDPARFAGWCRGMLMEYWFRNLWPKSE